MVNLKVYIHTLGCRLNQYESDSLEARFLSAGCVMVNKAALADLAVINTCTVTNKADRKTRNTISHIRSSMGITGRLVLTGCFVENHPEQFQQDHNTLLVDNSRKSSLFEITDAWLKGEAWNQPPGGAFDYPESGETRRTRAYLKIQDGCDQFCSYCIVPHVRGRAQSRDLQDIMSNARTLIGEGFRELVLTGVNISRWEQAPSPTQKARNFTALVESLLDLEGDFRLRIASLEPDLCDAGFAALFGSPKLMPHLHLCLQSGSPSILKAMGRQCSVEAFLDFCRQLVTLNPLFSITTDLICGFPGETDEDFRASLDTCRQAGFSRIHVFPYSRRSGTQADLMPGHIAHGIIMERCRQAQELSRELEEAFHKRLHGTTQALLCEKAWLEGSRVYLEGHVPSFAVLRASTPASPLDVEGFDQSRYRKHLHECLVTGSFSSSDGLVLEGSVLNSTKTGD